MVSDERMDDLFDLGGRVAVVTGSSQGIGLACATRMAERGARVVISSRTAETCEQRARELNDRCGAGRAVAVPCDVEEPDQIRALVARSIDAFGRIDCVVGNALVASRGTSWVGRTDESEMSRSLIGNVSNNLLLAKLVVPLMQEQGSGSIVYIASTAGVVAMEEQLAYGVSKAALIHMARILAVQLGPHDIRVNCVSPGLIASRGRDSPEYADGERERVIAGPTPLGRVGLADEIAGCVVWLASPGGAFATGQNFVVDGGQTLKGMHGPHDLFELARRRRRTERGHSGDPDPSS